MKSISLYVDQNTYLTRFHPFIKLYYTAAAVCAPLLAGQWQLFSVTIGVSLGLLLHNGLMKKAVWLITFSFTIILTIFLIHGLFNSHNQTLLFCLGPLKFYREGVFYALGIGMNIFNMLLAFAVFVLSTKPSQLVRDLEQIGFPPRFGYMLSSVFQIIPQMMGTMNTIMDAQRSRGLETEGNLMIRARAFIPLIFPVVSSSLISVRERAIALEVRGFDSGEKKTFLSEDNMSSKEKLLSLLLLLLVLFCGVWRLFHVIY